MKKDMITTILLFCVLILCIGIVIVLAADTDEVAEEGEVGAHTHDEFVEKTGDTMNGDLVVQNLYASGVINGDGRGLWDLNASRINTGSIDPARLPSTIQADYLDGLDSTDFAMAAHDHNNLYYLKTESDARYAQLSHTHPPGDADTLDGYDSLDFAMEAHTHDARYYQRSEVDFYFLNLSGGTMTGDLYLPNLYASGVINGDGSGLTDLNASYLTTGTIGLARLPTNINADTLDTYDSTYFAMALHTHDASEITSGTLDELRLPQNAIDNSEIEVGLSLVPSGTIVMWNGTIIPAGWNLCDGTNGTPDLTGMFVVSYDPSDPDYDSIGNTGGEKTHILTTSEMPSHSHSVTGTTSMDGDHSHDYEDRFSVGSVGVIGGGGTQVRDDFETFQTKTTQNAGAHAHSVSGTALSTGGGAAHENRPPYFVLAFIMKL